MTETARHRVTGTARASRLLAPVAVAGVLASATIAVATINPYANQIFPPCPIHAMTGLYCPGCGGTRAVYELSQGNLLGAAHMNAFVTLVLVPGIVVIVGWWLARAAGANLPPVRIPTWAVWVALSALAVFAVLRNLPPFLPFLAP